MKFCRWCQQTKEINEFYEHPMMADGHLNKCSECVREYARKRRLENDRVREIDARRYREGKKKASRAKFMSGHKDRMAICQHAAQIARRAVKRGLIQKADACEACGKHGVALEGAHHDYSRPLEVRWLCVRCHRRWDSATPKTLLRSDRAS